MYIGGEIMANNESWGEILYYLDGQCYGIASNGATICCGAEKEVRDILSDPEENHVNPVINSILQIERELIKEAKENARPESTRCDVIYKGVSRNKRSGFMPHAQPERKNTRLAKTKQRLSVR